MSARAAEYYREVAARDRQLAGEYRSKAAAAPVESRGRPNRRYPEGYLSQPRANLTAAAQAADRRAEEFDALAARIESSL